MRDPWWNTLSPLCSKDPYNWTVYTNKVRGDEEERWMQGTALPFTLFGSNGSPCGPA